MQTAKDKINPDVVKVKSIGGYHLKRVVELTQIKAFFYELEHRVTGTRHIHISHSDKENTFSVAFKTVPTDSTGVAHILEHTVLCGSNQYPVRDPFFSMLKRSLSTFMNAFTASDWTMYPFSTQNHKDFYNLMSVYLDAVFYPNLEELSFKQEGRRLSIEGDLDSDSLELTYDGVVYNEMKGAMSSPDEVMVRSLLHALYPETTYSHNSGGDPAEIPKLTYAQLKAFHRRHYHPSNAFFYTYGNLPLKAHLAFIEDTILKDFIRIDPETTVPSQPRWSEPQSVTYPYPLSVNEDPAQKYQACVAWLTSDIRDSFEVLVLVLLSEIFLGNAASPLRKALIDSGLGSALSDGSGFVSDHKDTLFACGLKNVKASAVAKIESIVFSVLENLSNKGIEKELIDSAIHQIEFHRKEITNTPYPYGIRLLLSFAGSWIHEGDPLKVLQFDADLKRLHEELARGRFFENRIKRYFLENPHRVLFTLEPDQSLEKRDQKRVLKELKRIKEGMSRSQLEKVQLETRALLKLQESKEDPSCLPTLELQDIPPDVQIVTAGAAVQKVPAVIFKQPTSGIFYLSGAAAIGSVSRASIAMIPFFSYAIPKMGTAKCNYVEMARRIDACSGGIGMSAHARRRFDDEGTGIPFISINAKCLYRNQARMTGIIEELLEEFDFSDTERLKNLLLQYRSQMESAVIHNGHRLAISLASRNFSSTSFLGETWAGIHQYQTIKGITEDLSAANLKTIADELATIGRAIFAKNNICLAMVGEEEALTNGSELLIRNRGLSALGQMGFEEGRFVSPNLAHKREMPREGWSTASAVSFVAQVFETVRMEHTDAPALSVISKMLRSLYLHREIREKGGAYGGFAIYNPENGLFSFGSYRDPHIVATLRVYAAASDFIKSGEFGDEDIKEAILQVCAEIDKPDPPGPAAKKAFFRQIIALSDEKRLQFKQNLLKLSRSQIQAAAETYFDQKQDRHAVAVISGEEQLNQANRKLGQNPLELHRI